MAVIPARSGSKRLPGKNIRLMNGQPLIVHTIKEALKCELLDKIIVSTDSYEIGKIALNAGSEVHIRNEELSTDDTTTISVLKDILSCLENFDICVTLQPTSPLRLAKDIGESLALYERMRAHAVISVCKVDHPPQWINKIGKLGEMNSFISNITAVKRSQELGDYYRLNGAIYCNNIQRLMVSETQFFDSKSYAYIMPSKRSIDIDNLEDFELAEYYMNK